MLQTKIIDIFEQRTYPVSREKQLHTSFTLNEADSAWGELVLDLWFTW